MTKYKVINMVLIIYSDKKAAIIILWAEFEPSSKSDEVWRIFIGNIFVVLEVMEKNYKTYQPEYRPNAEPGTLILQ